MATTPLAQPRVDDAPAPASSPIPRLENGDHLTRAEFERRYTAMPNLKKAELIEGVVYVPSPVRIDAHAQPHGFILGWLAAYAAATPGVQFGPEATLRLDLDNEPQPDALLRIEEATGGQSHRTEDGYLEGAPELIVEIAASSASLDRHAKLHVYRRNGVREYLLWQVLDRRLDWFALQDGEYISLQPDERGVIHSRVFPGLHLHVEALLEGNLAAVLSEQHAALATPEHQQFVASLTTRRQR